MPQTKWGGVQKEWVELPGSWKIRRAPENDQVQPSTLERAQKQLSCLPQASHEGESTTIRLAVVGLFI